MQGVSLASQSSVADGRVRSLRTPPASEDMQKGLGVYSGHAENQSRYSDEELLEQEGRPFELQERRAIVKRPVLGQ
jgi:hypothetical protein